MWRGSRTVGNRLPCGAPRAGPGVSRVADALLRLDAAITPAVYPRVLEHDPATSSRARRSPCSNRFAERTVPVPPTSPSWGGPPPARAGASRPCHRQFHRPRRADLVKQVREPDAVGQAQPIEDERPGVHERCGVQALDQATRRQDFQAHYARIASRRWMLDEASRQFQKASVPGRTVGRRNSRARRLREGEFRHLRGRAPSSRGRVRAPTIKNRALYWLGARSRHSAGGTPCALRACVAVDTCF